MDYINEAAIQCNRSYKKTSVNSTSILLPSRTCTFATVRDDDFVSVPFDLSVSVKRDNCATQPAPELSGEFQA